MKIWYDNIGDQKPSIVLPDAYDRPDSAGFLQLEDSLFEGGFPPADKYRLLWGGTDKPVLQEDPTFQERFAADRLKIVKEQRKQYIREKLAEAEKVPVVTSFGTFTGGEGSASAIGGTIQLSQFLGESEVVLTDAFNEEGTYTPEQAYQIAAAVGVVARSNFFRKQARMRGIEAATTEEAVNNVDW